MNEPIPFREYEDEEDRQGKIVLPPTGTVVWVWTSESLSWIPALCEKEKGGEPMLWSVLGNHSMSYALYHGWLSHWLPIDIPAEPPPR